MRPKHVSYSIYQPASSFAVEAGAVAIYQATGRQRYAIRAGDTPDSQLLAEEICRDLEGFLALLGPREKDIVQRHCGLLGQPESYTEIGERYGITRQRVYEIIKLALNKVRATIPRKMR